MKFSHYIAIAATVIVSGNVLQAAPSPGYYDDVLNLTSNTLRTALRAKIAPHTQVTYANAYNYLESIEEDPNNTDNILTHYSNESIPKTMRSVSTTGYWNREHIWPQSLGSATGTPMHTDLHHLWGEEMTMNSARNNKVFNNVPNPTNSKLGCKWAGNEFEVRDEAKGDVARALFYMELIYGATAGYTLTDDTNPPSGQMGIKTAMLGWHLADPADSRDALRNDRVYQYQGNRNPFSDRAEFAERLYDFGTVPTSSTATVSFTDATTASLTVGNPGNVMATFSVSVSSGNEWQFGSIQLKAAGTMSPSNAGNVKLYADIDRNGAVGSTDILLTQSTFTGDTVTLSAPNTVLAMTTASLPLLVTVDISADAQANETFALVTPANKITADPTKAPHVAPTYDTWQTTTVTLITTAPPVPPTPDPSDGTPTVVINKFINQTAAANETIELLVTKNGTNLAGIWLKDFSSSGDGDNGGGSQFLNVAKWQNLKAGTLVILTNGATPPEEKSHVLCASIKDTNLFTKGGGTFDIAGSEILMLKTGTQTGVAGSIHSVGSVSASATYWTAITEGSKQRFAAGIATAGTTVYVNNSTSAIVDYNNDAELKSASTSAPAFGSANSTGNATFIANLLPVTLTDFTLE